MKFARNILGRFHNFFLLFANFRSKDFRNFFIRIFKYRFILTEEDNGINPLLYLGSHPSPPAFCKGQPLVAIHQPTTCVNNTKYVRNSVRGIRNV